MKFVSTRGNEDVMTILKFIFTDKMNLYPLIEKYRRTRINILVYAVLLTATLIPCSGNNKEKLERLPTEFFDNQKEEILLPSWIGNHMIIPSNQEIRLYGITRPNTKIELNFMNLVQVSNSDSLGKWEFLIAATSVSNIAGEIMFTTEFAEKVIRNVKMGQVWLCSGQSNMELTLGSSVEKDQYMGEPTRQSDLRYFDGNKWNFISEESAQHLSAIGLWFAHELSNQKNISIGFMVAAQGGTGIEAWLDFESFPDTEYGRKMKLLAQDPVVIEAEKQDKADPRKYGEHRLSKWGLGRAMPGGAFRSRISKFREVPLSGIIWYQGETNALSFMQSNEYQYWLESLISSWRNYFDAYKLPFIVIQLPFYDLSTEAFENGWINNATKANEAWKGIQQAQHNVGINDLNTWALDIEDLGERDDIHPKRKREVGRRIANIVINEITSN